jgi:hypothetical protein
MERHGRTRGQALHGDKRRGEVARPPSEAAKGASATAARPSQGDRSERPRLKQRLMEGSISLCLLYGDDVGPVLTPLTLSSPTRRRA